MTVSLRWRRTRPTPPEPVTVDADREPTSVLVYDPATDEDILVHIDEYPLWGRSGGTE